MNHPRLKPSLVYASLYQRHIYTNLNDLEDFPSIPPACILVVDSGNKQIKKVSLLESYPWNASNTPSISIFSGSGREGGLDGHKLTSEYNNLYDLEIDYTGTFVLATDQDNCLIKKIYLEDMRSEMLTGKLSYCGYEDGYRTEALFTKPKTIVIDPQKRSICYCCRQHDIAQSGPGGSKVSIIQVYSYARRQ